MCSVADRHPGEQRLDVRPLVLVHRPQVDEGADRHDERGQHHRRRQVARRSARRDLRPNSRISRNPASGKAGINQMTSSTVQPLSSARSSVVAPGRRLRIEMMMPSPTTTSAAATTSTKNTAVWPSMLPKRADEGDEAQVDGVEHQLDAHEDHERVAPHEHADRAHREQHGREDQVVGGRRLGGGDHSSPAVPSSTSPREQHGAGDGDDQQDRGELEGEHVVVEQVVGELLDVVVAGGVERRCPRRSCRGRGRRRRSRARPARCPTTAASGRWIGNGSIDRSSALSTPSSMITNRNSTTIAPA